MYKMSFDYFNPDHPAILKSSLLLDNSTATPITKYDGDPRFDIPKKNNSDSDDEDNRGGRRRYQKRPTTRRLRLRSSKARKVRKARTTRRKY
jgi:hypothetical protein